MSPGQIMPGQMSPGQLESVLDVPKNLTLKFHQNRKETTEIFLICTNVALTNVIVTAGIWSGCFYEPSFKVSSKLGQLQLRLG